MTTLASSSSYVDWSSMFQVLIISIIAGAGLVTVFSLGLRALSASGYVRIADEQAPRRNVAALAGAALCLLIVIAGAIYGIYIMLDK